MRGATGFVALFILAVSPFSSVVSPVGEVEIAFAPAAHAKARTERLTIESAAGAVHTFEIEVARTERGKAVGLMFRTKLGDDQGMLFPYDTDEIVTMWMRNTYISLDMLFIKSDGVIHRIEERTEPLSERIISSGAPVLAVLELSGGAAARLGIKAGDRVRHPVFKPRATP